MLSMNNSVSAPVGVAEVFGHRQRRQGHPQPGPRRLVHLAEHHAGLLDHVAAGVADLGFLHFQPQVGALAGPLADAGEHRVAAVRAGDAGDQLGEDHGLAQAGTAEQARLAAADERRQQVDHLDAGLEHFGLGRQLGQVGSIAVDRPIVVGVDRAAAVDRLADQVEHAAQRGLADRHLDRRAGVDAVLPRTMPSVLPRATQRTRPPPRCCCTSPARSTLHALVFGCRSSRRCKSAGRWSSANSTSNVEPMTCVTWPMFFADG